MKVEGNNLIDGKKLLQKTHDLSQNQDTEKKENAQKTESGRDKVSLSGKSREISDLKGIIEGLPDIRRDRVEAFKAAVDTGTYTFDTAKLVQKIIQEEF